MQDLQYGQQRRALGHMEKRIEQFEGKALTDAQRLHLLDLRLALTEARLALAAK